MAGTVWPLCTISVGNDQAQQICGGSSGRRGSAERNSTRKEAAPKLRDHQLGKEITL